MASIMPMYSNAFIANKSCAGNMRKKTRARREAGGIDKSVLALAAPKRIRDDQHLKYIASLPCLVCGRTPIQAHHLRFAQSRAMGKK